MDLIYDQIEALKAGRKIACVVSAELLPSHSNAATFASAVVLAMTAAFYFYATIGHRGSGAPRYALQAVFLSSNGLHVGANVMLAGVKVGSVSSISLDPSAFVTRIVFQISTKYRLPRDTSLSIGSSGFTSANALLINPGHSRRMLSMGSVLRDTHEMQSLEQTVSQYIFGGGGLDDRDDP